MGKCDFCDKYPVGYTSMRAAFYCLDHEIEALEIEMKMWEEVEKFENVETRPIRPHSVSDKTKE